MKFLNLGLTLSLLVTTPLFAEDAAPLTTEGEKIVGQIIERLRGMTPPGQKLSAEQKKNNDTLGSQVRTHLDVDAMSLHTLGAHWQKRTDTEKKEFTHVFGNVVVHQASSKSSSSAYTVRIKNSELKNPTTVHVTTRISRKDSEPLTFQYVLQQNPGKPLRVVDLVVDEESLMDSYQKQFDSIITKKGFPELMKKLKNMLAGIKEKAQPTEVVKKKGS